MGASSDVWVSDEREHRLSSAPYVPWLLLPVCVYLYNKQAERTNKVQLCRTQIKYVDYAHHAYKSERSTSDR